MPDAVKQAILIVHAAVFLAGLPVLVVLLIRLTRQRGVGLPMDGAWPDVCWGRVMGGFQFVVGCIVVHLLVLSLLGWAATWIVDLKKLKGSDPVLAQIYAAVLMIAQWVVTCGIILWYISAQARSRPPALGLTVARLGRSLWTAVGTLAATMPAVITMLVAMLFAYKLFSAEPEVHPILQTIGETVDPWRIAVLVILSGVVFPFFEELFYRGFIMTAMLRSGNAAVAIVGSAVLFGAVHAPFYASVPALMVLGLGLGYAYYRTRSLWAPVLMHALFNLYNLAITIVLPLLVSSADSAAGT